MGYLVVDDMGAIVMDGKDGMGDIDVDGKIGIWVISFWMVRRVWVI